MLSLRGACPSVIARGHSPRSNLLRQRERTLSGCTPGSRGIASPPPAARNDKRAAQRPAPLACLQFHARNRFK